MTVLLPRRWCRVVLLSLANHLSALALVVVLALVSGVVVRAEDEQELIISPEIWKTFENDYLTKKRPGAFAVSADGSVVGYSYCSEYRCKLVPSARQIALDACARAGGKSCRIFAVGEDIKVKYRILGSSGTGPQADADESPAYLARCKSAPRGSNKVAYDANGRAICFNGIFSYREMCKGSPKGAKKTTRDAQGNITCYDGTMVIPGGPVANFLP
jgi:hypothetical protein